MTEPEKITIIEGPPPTFELVAEPLLYGLTEGPVPTQVALCRVRTFNGPALVERCYRAWRAGQTIRLEYRTEEGLTRQAPIIAVRWVELPEGDALLLWVRLRDDEIEVELDYFDEDEDDFDDGDFEDDVDFGFDLDDPTLGL